MGNLSTKPAFCDSSRIPFQPLCTAYYICDNHGDDAGTPVRESLRNLASTYTFRSPETRSAYTGGVAVEVLPRACIAVGTIVSSGT
jgi:hypothetical protein